MPLNPPIKAHGEASRHAKLQILVYAPAHPSSLRKTYLKHKAIDLYREDGTIIECTSAGSLRAASLHIAA